MIYDIHYNYVFIKDRIGVLINQNGTLIIIQRNPFFWDHLSDQNGSTKS